MACWLLIVFGILGTTWNVKCDDETKYDNYTLLRIFPTNNVNLEELKKFNDPENQVEVLKQTRGYNSSLDVLVPPERMEFVEDFAKSKDMMLEVKQKNYGRTLEAQDRIPRRRVLRGNPAFQYSSFSVIQGFVESTAKRHPEFVTLQPVGKSYEGRALTLVKISSDQHAQNPIIFIDAGIHAREWVAPAMAIYLIDRLTNDVEARKRELAGVDWYILPVVNPDGYEYTRSGRRQRMWRKTRSVTANGCYGVDANRNYGFKWAVSGVSNDPCNAETYAGPRPFSEPETRVVRDIMMSYQNRLKLYVSLHSYGQYLVYPWGFSGDYLPKTWKKLDALARKVSLAVSGAGGKPFHVMSAGQWYPAAGASDDYAFGGVGVPYSYTMELTDDHEFIFPERLLKEVLPQFYEGFKVFGAHIKRQFSNRDQAGRTAGLDDYYTLIRIFPTNNVNLKALKKFNDPENQVEVLKKTRGYNSSLDILVPPERMEFVEDFAKSKDMLLEVKQKNYGRALESLDRILRKRVLRGNPAFQYSSFSAIQAFVESVAKKRPELVTLQPVGESYEGRQLTLVKISSKRHAHNPIIFIDAGIHAREWVTPAMAIYIIDRLTSDVEARKRELDSVDWYILPVVNPDGYEYSRTGSTQRMWRKTRSPTGNGCFGVDGNRNFGFKWGLTGATASHDPCHVEIYAGPRPFSEPEIKAVRDIMMSNAERMSLYVTLHTYGQHIIHPWGYTGDFLPKTVKKLDFLARNFSLAVSSAGGKPFDVTSAGELYPTAGSSVDYAFGGVGVPYSYVMELTDGHEFIFPERLLKEALPQYYEGFKVFGAHIKKEFSNVAAKTAGFSSSL